MVTRSNSQVTVYVCVYMCYCSWVVAVTNTVVVVTIAFFFSIASACDVDKFKDMSKYIMRIMSNINAS